MAGEVQIVNASDELALDTRHTVKAGARIQMYTRNDPPNRNQVWVLDADGRLRCGHPDSEFVLDLAGEPRAGTPVLLAIADPARPSQRWDFADGRFANRAAPDLVLATVPPGGKEARVALARRAPGAADSPQQRWALQPVDPDSIYEPEPYDGDDD